MKMYVEQLEHPHWSLPRLHTARRLIDSIGKLVSRIETVVHLIPSINLQKPTDTRNRSSFKEPEKLPPVTSQVKSFRSSSIYSSVPLLILWEQNRYRTKGGNENNRTHMLILPIKLSRKNRRASSSL